MKILQKYKFWILIFLSFLFLRLPSLFEPYWYGDEGIYLVLGQGIRKGLTLYSQIHDNKPPLLYYLAALGQTVFGFRLLLLVCMIPTIVLFYKLAQNFLSEKLSKIALILFLIVTSIPLFEGNIANAEIFMLLPTIAGVLLVYTSQKNADFLLAGLLLGLAFIIKVPVVIELVFLCFWLFINLIPKTKFKEFFSKIFLLLVGFVIPISMFGFLFFVKGAFKNFIYAALLQNFGYLSSWSTGTHTASATSGGLMTRLVVLVIFFLVVGFIYFKQKIDQKLAFILLWFAATVFGTLLSGRPYPHYLIQVLSPLCLSLIYIFETNKIYFKIASLSCFLFLIFVVKKYNFYFYPVFSYYGNFYSYVLHLKNQNQYRTFFGSEVNSLYQTGQYLKQNTKINEKIFVWGDSPFIYALSDRLPVGRYTVAYHIADFNGYQETINLLKANPPQFIVYYQMPGRPFPELDNFLSLYYYPDNSFGSSIIYKYRQ